MQASSIKMKTGSGYLTITGVYCPPCLTIPEEQFMDLCNSLGNESWQETTMPIIRTRDLAKEVSDN